VEKKRRDDGEQARATKSRGFAIPFRLGGHDIAYAQRFAEPDNG